MTLVPITGRTALRRRSRLRWALVEGGSLVLGAALLIWSLTPVYHMLLVALDPDDGEIEFSGIIWPEEPSFDSFHMVFTEGHGYLEDFWLKFGNSICIGLMTMLLTMLIASLASFAVGRLRLVRGSLLTNTALLTYAIPASFLVIPFYSIMHSYGLSDTLWAVIAADVTFAAPYAVLILLWYARLIPVELDEAARVDGASAAQMYLRIYLPLMAPAMAAVGTFSLLLAWNDYVYQFLLLSSTRNMTVATVLAQFFANDASPWA